MEKSNTKLGRAQDAQCNLPHVMYHAGTLESSCLPGLRIVPVRFRRGDRAGRISRGVRATPGARSLPRLTALRRRRTRAMRFPRHGSGHHILRDRGIELLNENTKHSGTHGVCVRMIWILLHEIEPHRRLEQHEGAILRFPAIRGSHAPLDERRYLLHIVGKHADTSV
jgi:hypothetical protein